MDRRPESRPAPESRPVEARPVDRARRGPVATTDRAASAVRRIAALVLRLALLALVGGGLVWWAVARSSQAGSLALGVVGVILLAPPFVLALAWLALRALAELPRRLREAPAMARDRAGELRRLAGRVAESRRQGLRSQIAALVRLGWTASSSREVLELSPALALLTPPMLGATVVAAAAAVVEVLAGVVALASLAAN